MNPLITAGERLRSLWGANLFPRPKSSFFFHATAARYPLKGHQQCRGRNFVGASTPWKSPLAPSTSSRFSSPRREGLTLDQIFVGVSLLSILAGGVVLAPEPSEDAQCRDLPVIPGYDAEAYQFYVQEHDRLYYFIAPLARQILVETQKINAGALSPEEIITVKLSDVERYCGILSRSSRKVTVDDLPSLTFQPLGIEELRHCQISFKKVNGADEKKWVYDISEEPVVAGTYIYVYYQDKLYIHKKHENVQGPVFYHGCFTDRLPVQCAGYISFKRNSDTAAIRVDELNNHSGHYRPQQTNLDRFFEDFLKPKSPKDPPSIWDVSPKPKPEPKPSSPAGRAEPAVVMLAQAVIKLLRKHCVSQPTNQASNTDQNNKASNTSPAP